MVLGSALLAGCDTCCQRACACGMTRVWFFGVGSALPAPAICLPAARWLCYSTKSALLLQQLAGTWLLLLDAWSVLFQLCLSSCSVFSQSPALCLGQLRELFWPTGGAYVLQEASWARPLKAGEGTQFAPALFTLPNVAPAGLSVRGSSVQMRHLLTCRLQACFVPSATTMSLANVCLSGCLLVYCWIVTQEDADDICPCVCCSSTCMCRWI